MKATRFIVRLAAKIDADDCLGKAAQLSFSLLFAFFPFTLFLVTLLGYLPIEEQTGELLALLSEVLPEEVFGIIAGHVSSLTTARRGELLSFGIAAALWTASGAVIPIRDVLNRAWEVQETRSFWRVRAVAILLTVGLALFLLALMVALVFGPLIGGWAAELLGLGEVFRKAWALLRWPLVLGLLVVALPPLYHFAPNVRRRWRWITPGAVFAILGSLGASLGFSYYVANFASYHATYGSIGAVIVTLAWLYLVGLIILVGGEVDAALAHLEAQEKGTEKENEVGS